MTSRKFVAIAALAILAVGATACSSSEDTASTTSTTRAAAPTTTTTAGGGGTTTTTEGGSGAECTRGEIISAALTQVDPRFDLMDSFGCEDGYAWAWLADDSTDPATLQSAILEDRNGQWQPLDLANICGAASAGYPPEVLEKGCAYQTPAQPTATTGS